MTAPINPSTFAGIIQQLAAARAASQNPMSVFNAPSDAGARKLALYQRPDATAYSPMTTPSGGPLGGAAAFPYPSRQQMPSYQELFANVKAMLRNGDPNTSDADVQAYIERDFPGASMPFTQPPTVLWNIQNRRPSGG